MFTKKELKLIEEALLAYDIEPEETKIYSKIDKLINKPVETTNEQPLYDNLKEWFEDSLEEDKDYPNWKKIHTHIIRCSNNIVNFQFKGFELVLLPDGKYILGDTSGG